MMFFRSLIFSLVMIIFTVFYATVSLFTFPFSANFRYRFITTWSKFIIWWAKFCCNIDYRVIGLDNLPKQPCVILSKHQSTWETLAFQVFLPMQTWVMKKELLRVPFFGWALSLLEPIAIDRKEKLSAAEQLIKQGKERLQSGRYIIVFPEGTRVKTGDTKSFAKGGAALAKAVDRPIVLVAHNAGKHWPRRGFLKIPGTITVVIGPTIDTSQHSVQDINAIAKKWIDETTRQLETEKFIL